MLVMRLIIAGNVEELQGVKIFWHEPDTVFLGDTGSCLEPEYALYGNCFIVSF